jgi:ATP-dependent DNA ligase
MNRDKQPISNVKLPKDEFLRLHRGEGWMVLVGEYMNKSQTDSKGKVFNHKFVIFDILVFQGEKLEGKTFSERQSILDVIYEWKPCNERWLSQLSENVFRADNITEDFEIEYGCMTQYGMYEGLVMKRPDAKLAPGISKVNNTGWQLKCRKATKNYSR